MTHITILKGRDIALCRDGVVLPGITGIVLDEIRTSYEIMEYLCGEGHTVVNLNRRWKLRVKALSLLDESSFEGDGYTLSFCKGSTEYRLGGCCLSQRSCSLSPDDYAAVTYEISARTMEVRNTDERSI